ncbi:MAG: hypothetical protein KKB31_07210 [Nanoarchaeota archaeon]|nr:hypothetical protein [Nanoarchaeota archaeon]
MASAEESGQVILELADKEESRVKEVFRFGTSLVSQATKTPSGETVKALPVMSPTIYKGKRLVVSFISDATDIIESEESDFTIPVAYVNQASGRVEFVKDTKLAQYTGFTPAGTVDITCTAGTKQRVCYLDAPDGYLLTLGAGRKFHAYVGDDTV